ncbi:hypothetical protein HNQ79_000297 [Streptomyces candidus]|uniref:Uncharacterized protein n=1 Tax=Streptomyces candidus TaxID=67283 RepID=A0A7X0LMX3_9ACTN|nr:hypothetical protein [Streptomyces candidus]
MIDTPAALTFRAAGDSAGYRAVGENGAKEAPGGPPRTR